MESNENKDNKELKEIKNIVNKEFTEREFEEVDGGQYLENGFYITPNGSFWDSDGVYFNKHGYDKHEGYYNNEYEYQPGRGWIPHMLCYEDDLPEEVGENDELDYENLDDLHEEVNYSELAENKEKSECIIKKDILIFTQKNNDSNK